MWCTIFEVLNAVYCWFLYLHNVRCVPCFVLHKSTANNQCLLAFYVVCLWHLIEPLEMVYDLPSLWRQAYQAVCFIYKKKWLHIYIYIWHTPIYENFKTDLLYMQKVYKRSYINIYSKSQIKLIVTPHPPLIIRSALVCCFFLRLFPKWIHSNWAG